MLVTISVARAASPLAAIAIGTSVAYHLTVESNSPESGPQSASHFVSFKRISANALQLSVDGAAGGTVTFMSDGTVQYPPALKQLLAPFGAIGLFMRGAPQPLSPGASWAANFPVPIKDQTDNVPLVVSVTQIGPGGATIVANGTNSTTAQPAVRKFPATVSVKATLSFTAAHMLSSANSTVSITVQTGHFGVREKHFGSSWTIARANQ